MSFKELNRDNDVSLDGGQTYTNTFTWDTSDFEDGGHQVRVRSADTEDIITVSLGAPDYTVSSLVSAFDARLAFIGESDGTQVTDWQDETGTYTASGGSPTIRNDGINGNRSLEFDGTDDSLLVDDNAFTEITQPYTIIGVVELTDTTSHQHIFDDQASGSTQMDFDGSNWRIYAGSVLSGGTDTTIQLLTGVYDGTNSEILTDGTSDNTGDVGADSMEEIGIGKRHSQNDRHLNGYIGHLEVHDGLPSNGLSTREQAIADYWDISI